MTTKKPEQLPDNKKNEFHVEQTNTNSSSSKSPDPNPTNQAQEQFCSCCKPANFFDFLNKKKTSDMFCSETFVPDLKFANNQSKSHKIFVKKNDI